MATNTRFIVNWTLNGCIAVVVVSIFLVYILGFIDPHRPGFFCDDQSISYPYKGDTITSLGLFLFCVFGATIFLALCEYAHHWINGFSVDREGSVLIAPKRYGFPWAPFFRNFYVLLMGAVCCLGLTVCLQLTIGGLRPHFIDICKPNFNAINCSSGYVTNYTCTSNKTSHELAYLFRTFPSGHALSSAYMSVFFCFYINKRLFGWPTVFVSSIVQACLLVLASFCATSRIRDHTHHVSDVVGGAIIGTIIAAYTAMWLWTDNPDIDCSRPSDSLDNRHLRFMGGLEDTKGESADSEETAALCSVAEERNDTDH